MNKTNIMVTETTINNKKADLIEFKSLNDFYNYICETPINETFRWRSLSSSTGDYEFTKTSSYEEAIHLFKHGDEDTSHDLTQTLKLIENEVKPMVKQKASYGVAGYQAITPLYLNNCPNSMMYKKNVVVKQKVVTINKSIDYKGSTTVDTMIEESIKALQIVKKIESQGYRVNLNIVLGATEPDFSCYVKIRIKSASEKLNVSKTAFPLVNPSMLRRLFFRFIEVYPKITESFKFGYGKPASSNDLRTVFSNDYLLPNFIKKDINSIRTINDLENI